MAAAPGYQDYGYSDPLETDPSVLVRGLKKRAGLAPTDPLNPYPAVPAYPTTSTTNERAPSEPGDPTDPNDPRPPITTPPVNPPTTTPPTTTPPGTAPPALDALSKAIKAKDWKTVLELFTKSSKYSDPKGTDPLKDPAFIQQLTFLGFKISPPNAAGEVTKIQTPDGHWVRVLGGPREGYTWTYVDNGPEGTGGNNQTSSSLTESLLEAFKGNAANRAKMHDMVNGLLDKYSKDPTADDPIIKGQVDAYHGISERSLQDAQAQMAERAHAEGVTSGAYDSQIQNATLTQGRQEGALQSGLMANELLSRRKALSDTLNTNAAMLSDEDKMNLQARIAGLDETLRNQQFYDELARLLAKDANGSDADLLRQLLGL